MFVEKLVSGTVGRLDVLQLDSICANMPHNHTVSRRIAEKIGMQLEAEFVNKRNRDILTNLYRKNRKAT
ncbi:hypothetical protein [Paenibacillus sp. KN14-4R]|uniref:hypothetical protein n=1 Tax=Paenibacillus sp. KN14-4R TaxID=3445773 RepID=UPI003FA0683B